MEYNFMSGLLRPPTAGLLSPNDLLVEAIIPFARADRWLRNLSSIQPTDPRCSTLAYKHLGGTAMARGVGR